MLTTERKEALRELVDNRIEHRKAEEKYFYAKYERENPFSERGCSAMQWTINLKQAYNAHMAEYDNRIN